MHSLRKRITLLTVCLIAVAVAAIAFLSVYFIRNSERKESDQLLLLLCETGERNLDQYFNGVQKSVKKVASFVENDLDGIEDAQLEEHMKRVRQYFEEMSYRTNGVLTYYYRIDPEISNTVKGFWYTNLDGEGFAEHEVTDIGLYDTEDTERLVWFTVPKHSGQPIWLTPYITDNLDVRVISYNVPIYWRGRFMGVVGIEIDYSTMAEQVDSIRLYGNGYAFLCDENGKLFYHPRIDVTMLTEETMPEVPSGLIDDSTFIRYTFDKVEKRGAWLPLSNGMRLVMTLPVSETNGDSQSLVRQIVIAALAVLLILSIIALYCAKTIVKPIEALTRAAEAVDKNNFDFSLDYNGNDEVGRLTQTFKRLAAHMRDHIDDLNERAYVDALTSVKSKEAFNASVEDLQAQSDVDPSQVSFAIGMFDCDDLKLINDEYGHELGDVYLKTACRLICQVFHHSPVFRIGGDEFAVILRNEDYTNRERLIRELEISRQKINVATENRWEQIHMAMGFADYDPKKDRSVLETVHRADNEMYASKRQQKDAREYRG